jgi:hypothetical protein
MGSKPSGALCRDVLLEAVQNAADNSEEGTAIKGFPQIRYIFAKWKGARYGHNIIFESESKGIYVLRILHSSMDIVLNLT